MHCAHQSNEVLHGIIVTMCAIFDLLGSGGDCQASDEGRYSVRVPGQDRGQGQEEPHEPLHGEPEEC